MLHENVAVNDRVAVALWLVSSKMFSPCVFAIRWWRNLTRTKIDYRGRLPSRLTAHPNHNNDNLWHAKKSTASS